MSDVDVDVLFRQAGVIRVDTLEELFDAAVLLAHQPLPGGNRVAIVGNSGGVVTITADACEARGLEVPKPGLLDLGPLAGAEDYRKAVQRALQDPDLDALIAIFLCVGECDPELVARGIRRGVISAEKATGAAKPVLLCLMGATGLVKFAFEARASVSERRTAFPSYRFPEAAARALAHAVTYAAYRRQPPGRLVWFEDADASAARGKLEAALAGVGPGAGPHWVGGERAGEILGCFGIGVAAGEAPAAGRHVHVGVRPHPNFGPLIVLQAEGGPAIERITPLTDQDVRGMLEAVGLSPGEKEAELLCRLSQLIEEVPWLVELHAEIRGPAGEERRATLGGDLHAALTPPA
jgi:acyl-CoA synthetase (NDP forming)